MWKGDTYVTERSVDALVKRLRKKIETDPASPRFILTVWGTGTSSPMSERAWYRSLYWRIAIGFVLFLAGMLVAQGAAILWLAARASANVPGRTPIDLAALVASDLSAFLASEPAADAGPYLREHYGGLSRPVVFVTTDGKLHASRPFEMPPGLIDMALRRMQRHRPPGFDEPGTRAPRRFAAFAPVIVDGRTAGMVVVPPFAPLPELLREFAPGLSALALALLAIGTGLAALMVFRPAHRRLQALEDAARRFGAGEPAARAPQDGGDEIAGVARAFNQMADVLNARADELRASDQARRQLLADVSHELMTPLTAIRGYLETMQMAELQLNDETRGRYLGIVQQETQRLERTVGDLLDLARLDAGGLTLSTQRRPREGALPARAGTARARVAREGRHAHLHDRSRGRTPFAATATGWSRRCRTSRPTRCATPGRRGRSSCARAGRTGGSAWPSATPGKAFRRSISRTCSIGSTAWTDRARAVRVEAASASRSSRPLPNDTGATYPRAVGRESRRCSR